MGSALSSGSADGRDSGSGDASRTGSGVSSLIGSGVGSLIGSGVSSRLGSGVGSRIGSGVGSRTGSGVGSRIGSGVGSRIGSGVSSLTGSGVASNTGAETGSGAGDGSTTAAAGGSCSSAPTMAAAAVAIAAAAATAANISFSGSAAVVGLGPRFTGVGVLEPTGFLGVELFAVADLVTGVLEASLEGALLSCVLERFGVFVSAALLAEGFLAGTSDFEADLGVSGFADLVVADERVRGDSAGFLDAGVAGFEASGGQAKHKKLLNNDIIKLNCRIL